MNSDRNKIPDKKKSSALKRPEMFPIALSTVSIKYISMGLFLPLTISDVIYREMSNVCHKTSSDFFFF